MKTQTLIFLGLTFAFYNLKAQNTFPSSGNVGIGTLSPSATLDVSGQSLFGAGATDTNVGLRGYNGSTSQIYNNSGLSANYNGFTLISNANRVNNLPSWVLDLGGADNITYHNSDSYSIRRMNAELFKINSSGYVGIGTSSPASTLDVFGQSFFGTGNTDTNIGLRGYNGSASQIYNNSGVSANYNGLTLTSNVTHSNNLPSWVLDLGGADNINYHNSDSYSVRRMNTEFFKITSSGNIGIGNSSPSYKLDVNGSGKFNNGVFVYDGQAFGVVSTIGAQWANNTILYKGYTQNVGDFTELLVAGGPQYNSNLRLLSSGNVLIGKTAQQNNAYRLDVAGPVRADAITVNTSGADYVFEDGYKLKTLADIEAFISNHKHLPEIPSAAEMQKEGANLGDMNKKLLQKIEELTLYLIHEHQLNNQQMQLLKKQDSRIKKLERKMK